MTGIEAGLVLPTGQFNQKFESGPEEGEEVDRGLQPGPGRSRPCSAPIIWARSRSELGYFVQATGQVPDHRDGYKPGSFARRRPRSTTRTGATSRRSFSSVSGQTWRDSGPNSDRPNSGGSRSNVAPGLSAKLGTKLVGFTYVELPLYTRVNGFQLVPKAKFSVGLLFHL